MFEHKCDKCDLVIERGQGSRMYVVNDQGERKICPHPAEVSAIAQTLNIDKEDVAMWLSGKRDKLDKNTKELLSNRVGLSSKAICFDCATVFDIDLKRDERTCPKCHSKNIKPAPEAVGEQCPKCHEGTFRVNSTKSTT